MKLCAFPWASVSREGGSGKVSINEWLDLAQRYGLDGLEVPSGWIGPSDSPEAVKAFKERLADHGLAVGMYNLGLQNWVDPSTVEQAKPLVEMAAELGAPLLRMMAQRWHPQIKEISRSQAIRASVEGLAKVAEIAAPYGISLAIENHHDHVGIELADFVQILNGLPMANVGVNFDPKHPSRVGEDTMTFLRHPKVLGRIKCTHLDNYSDTVDGWNRNISLDEGDLDIAAVIVAIRDSGYDGWLSIEFGGSDVTKVERSVSFVREVWEGHGC